MSPEYTNSADQTKQRPTFEPGQPVIVLARDKFDSEGNPIGERVLQAGWEVVRTEADDAAQNAGKVFVRKFDGSKAIEKYISPEELQTLQDKFEAIPGREGLTVVERREIGHTGLEAAGVPDPSEPPMWSEEWSRRQREPKRAESVADATADKPYYFPEPRLGEFTTTRKKVDIVGVYDSPQGNMLIVSDPLDPNVVEHVPVSDITMLQTRAEVTKAQEISHSDAEAQIEELLSSVEIGPRDKQELDSYTLARGMGSDFITRQNLGRMSSDQVRAIADKYADLRTKTLQSN